jgi:hypothetical protein
VVMMVGLVVIARHVEDPARELVRGHREEFRCGGAGGVRKAWWAEGSDSC